VRIDAVFIFTALVLIFTYPSACAAEILRCGAYLIQEGDDAFSVTAKCGEPTERMTITEPLYANSDGGGTYPTGQVAYSRCGATTAAR